MTPEAIQQLLDRYISEELSREEFLALWQTLSQQEYLAQWEQQMDDLLSDGGYEELASPLQQQLVLESILHHNKEQAPVVPMKRRKISWAAASVLLLLSGGAYFWYISGDNVKQPVRQAIVPHDIPPGKDGAILTLSDGARVVLDDRTNGVIATENGSEVILNNNAIAYTPRASATPEVVYNTLSTPRGRQFHVQLPDGTHVWLNAASSIRYPAAFTGKDRKVTVTGEVFIDVAKNPQQPFLVDVDGKMEVQVLGTSFNVNAYADGPSINTTLIDGAVKVLKDGAAGSPILLSPGQQAKLKAQELQLIQLPDLKMVMAWKDGYFIFDHTPLDEILRQFARWYDIEVVYENGIPDFALSGGIRRDFTLTEALITLEKIGLRYRIVDKKLTVLK
ncbi:FecR family protein [Pseudobacter ginsenosidimutans]|uniref:FecR family protein n=1 Tax=Pseudobacter ginsenosidimutans TaxID=661488 RepID=A0A4Q7MBJ8_9BACT|nr:FecR family protein [Pseudobacter ginsenosidimutans]QEC45325.1 DUF4974 domain-containing protein [Pseudobacter ginsenosidimutans]RZS65595.1 FecR family protein [Pseudobacter ginsenosidimutans]